MGGKQFLRDLKQLAKRKKNGKLGAMTELERLVFCTTDSGPVRDPRPRVLRSGFRLPRSQPSPRLGPLPEAGLHVGLCPSVTQSSGPPGAWR